MQRRTPSKHTHTRSHPRRHCNAYPLRPVPSTRARVDVHTHRTDEGQAFPQGRSGCQGPCYTFQPSLSCSRLGQEPSEVWKDRAEPHTVGWCAEPWPVGKPGKPFWKWRKWATHGEGFRPPAQQAGLGPPLLERLPLRPIGCHDLGPLRFPHGASYLEPPFLTHLCPYPIYASHNLGKTLSLHRFPQEISCCAPALSAFISPLIPGASRHLRPGVLPD